MKKTFVPALCVLWFASYALTQHEGHEGHGHAASSAAAESVTVLSGRLLNKSAEGGTPLADYPVVLQKHEWTSETDIRETSRAEGRTDTNGRFEFRGLTHHEHTFYTVSADFQGVRYVSDPVFPMEPEKMRSVELAVYETRGQEPALSYHLRHILVVVEKERLQVQEMLLLKNPENYSYSHPDSVPPPSFRVPFPCENFKAMEGLPEDVQPQADGKVEIHRPIRPGILQIMLEYSLPRRKELVFATGRPVEIVTVIVDGKDADVSSPELGAGETVRIEGQDYVQFSARNLESGNFRLNVKYRWSSEQVLIYSALGAALLLAFTGFGVTLLLKKRSAAAESPKETSALPQPSTTVFSGETDERERLLQEIADLDARYEKGLVSAQEYSRLRGEYKERLMRLMQSRLN
jgi:hypothetical protein